MRCLTRTLRRHEIGFERDVVDLFEREGYELTTRFLPDTEGEDRKHRFRL